MSSKDVVTIKGFAKEVGRDIFSRYREGFDEGRESAHAVGLVTGRESIVHALTATRFGPETADRVAELTRSLCECEDGFGISSADRIGICVLTCATADDLLARVREVEEEESNRARWFEDDPRAGWADAARDLAARRDDGPEDDPTPTVLDESEG